MKIVMQGDGGKPKQTFPKDFRPGGRPVEGSVVLSRNRANWQVLGADAFERRLFARSGESTAWLECGNPVEVHEFGGIEPVGVVCACPSVSEGFTFESELEMWVHAECRKPKRLYLDTLVQRLLAGELV